jgi:hypothetical protein
MIKNYSIQDIVDRIAIHMPSAYTRDDASQLIGILKSIAEVLKINTDLMDEMERQTMLVSATGEYVDEYITDLSKIGRKNNTELDEDYKTRYKNCTYKYNCTKQGLKLVVIDLVGNSPYNMYNGNKKGVYYNSKSYYDDAPFKSTYGAGSNTTYVGYIEFSRKPNIYVIDDLCKIINDTMAKGVKIYLKYPPGNSLTPDFNTSLSERVVLV